MIRRRVRPPGVAILAWAVVAWAIPAWSIAGGGAGAGIGPGASAAAAAPSFAAVTSNHAIAFPEDYGSHPDFRTEWWYVTGWLTTQAGESLGFQITFFRTKPGIEESNPSSFAPHQLLIAHCALSDPKHGRLWQDQRIRRAGLGLAEAAVGDANIRIDRWTLEREASGRYAASIDAEDFSIHVELSDTQPPLLNGNSGVSRKGPAPFYSTYPFEHLIGPGIGRAEYGGFLMSLPARRMYDVWADPD